MRIEMDVELWFDVYYEDGDIVIDMGSDGASNTLSLRCRKKDSRFVKALAKDLNKLIAGDELK